MAKRLMITHRIFSLVGMMTILLLNIFRMSSQEWILHLKMMLNSQEWTQLSMPSPQEWRWTVTISPRSILGLTASGNKIKRSHQLKHQAPSQACIQALSLQLRHKLHRPGRKWQHTMLEIVNSLRSMSQA